MKLTPGERLWIILRRIGMSQGRYAELYGVSPNLVTEWVRDRKEAPDMGKVVSLAPNERLSLYRRRAGLSIGEAAKGMGISKNTLIKRERGAGRVRESLKWWDEVYYGGC